MHHPTIIMTGHRGFIGSALKEALSESYPGEFLPMVSDLVNLPQMQSELAQLKGDSALVLHFATVNRRDCTAYAGHAANCAMLTNLIHATDRFAQRQFLFASSTDVFGRPASLPLDEASPHQPLDWYGLSKSVGESILRLEEVESAIFRLPGVFGARANERSILRQLLEQGLKQGAVSLSSKGQVLRDFVYLDDLVALFKAWIKAPRSGVWNVASGQATSLFDSLALLRSAAGVSFDILPCAEKSDRDFDLIFDSAKLRHSFPSTPIRPAANVFKEYSSATLRHSVAA